MYICKCVYMQATQECAEATRECTRKCVLVRFVECVCMYICMFVYVNIPSLKKTRQYLSPQLGRE